MDEQASNFEHAGKCYMPGLNDSLTGLDMAEAGKPGHEAGNPDMHR
ncbi:MAG: hypothetical protein VB959_19580 [Rhodospirillales bacterium]